MFQVKIQGQNLDMLKAACEQFLGKTSREVHQIALETLVSFILFVFYFLINLVTNMPLRKCC